AMLSEFGMTPASRAKVTMNTPAEEDPFEAFLKKRK
ncbi:phage terminase small subunit P27 family, partial [Proteus terrae]|nr:phage terminase small subunit P27 family [Proteus terrae]